MDDNHIDDLVCVGHDSSKLGDLQNREREEDRGYGLGLQRKRERERSRKMSENERVEIFGERN